MHKLFVHFLSWAGLGIEKSVARLQQIEYNGDESLGMQREADPLLETHPGAAGLLRWASHNFCHSCHSHVWSVFAKRTDMPGP